MKHFLFAFLSIFVFNNLAAAQSPISITSTDMPAVTDTFRYSVASPLGFDVSQTGANQTWNFATLMPIRQALAEYKRGLQTPYSVLFGFNAYGLKIADTLGFQGTNVTNVYEFYNNTAAKFETVGVGLTFIFPIPSLNTDRDEIYQFPLNYLDRDSSTFAVSFSLLGNTLKRKGYRINKVDGWGTITTPFGAFPCVRVESYIDEIDSVSVSGNTFGINIRRKEYKWLAKNVKIPILQVDGAIANDAFTVNSVRYRDSYRSTIGIRETNQGLPNHFSVSAFPNPIANETLLLVLNTQKSGVFGIEIKDISGKIVYQNTPQTYMIGEQFISIDFKNQSKGIYFATIKSQGETFVQKFIKE